MSRILTLPRFIFVLPRTIVVLLPQGSQFTVACALQASQSSSQLFRPHQHHSWLLILYQKVINPGFTMLPSGLSSTYQQYKHDTNVVASWLATTALGAGFSAPLGQPVTPSKVAGSQRLKGKARKEAKKQQSAETKSAQDHAKPKHIIAIKDFVPLANYISGKLSASIAVPEYFSTALSRAIEARRRFSTLLREFRPFREVSGDKKHAHFVSVLEKVRDVFGSGTGAFSMATMSAAVHVANTPQGRRPGDVIETKNMFDALRVHEPSESFLAAPDVSPPSSASMDYGVEEEDGETESLFVFSTLLADLFQLRDEIRAMWTEYRTGTKDLAAVSVATNAALQLARSMETEISPLLERLGGPAELISMAFGGACEARGLHPDQKKSFSDDFNYDCYEEANLFMYTSISLLDAYRRVPVQADPSYNGSFGWYNERTVASNNRQRWQNDKSALLEVFADMSLITSTFKGVHIQDEFSRGLHLMTQTKKIPGIWLCFAASTYLDILKVLGPDVRKGEREFHRIARSIADAVTRSSETYGSRSPELSNAMTDIQEISTMWAPGRDIFTLFRIGLRDRDSAFLAHNPMFCGLYVHFVRGLFHRTGVEFASRGNVMHSVQLYQALRQERLLGEDHKRQELDAILETQGTSAFFVGNPPTSLEGYFKNFGLTKGISASHWVPTNRNQRGQLPRSQAGIRTMKFKAMVSFFFANMADVSTDFRGLNAEVIDQILEKTGWFKKRHGSRDSELHGEQETLNATSSAGNDSKVRYLW